MREIIIDSPEQMEDFGRRVAGDLRAGDLIVLEGELGAGKTTFTRGLGDGLGVEGTVSSPTFVLARTHPRPAGPPLVHVDAYRLSGAAELDDLDLDMPGSITVVEWGAGLLDGASESWLSIAIQRPTGADAGALEGDELVEPRVVRLEGHGPRWHGHPLVSDAV